MREPERAVCWCTSVWIEFTSRHRWGFLKCLRTAGAYLHYQSHSDLINKNLCEKSEKKRIFCRIGHFPTVPLSTSRFRYLEKQQLFDLPLPRCLAPTALTPRLWLMDFCNQHYPAKGGCQAFQKTWNGHIQALNALSKSCKCPPFHRQERNNYFQGDTVSSTEDKIWPKPYILTSSHWFWVFSDLWCITLLMLDKQLVKNHSITDFHTEQADSTHPFTCAGTNQKTSEDNTMPWWNWHSHCQEVIPTTYS